MNGHAALPHLDIAHAMKPVRAQGRIDVRFKRHGNATVIADLAEGGGYRVKFPKTGENSEAVIINTGGGMTGGDALTCQIHAGPLTNATITGQSAEKIYRSSGLDTRVEIGLHADASATLAWLPQETILFSGARIRRDIHADIAHDAHLLIAESMIFGRVETGEILGEGFTHDRWRFRRGQRLIYADEARFSGVLDALLKRPAVLRGMCAMSTILYVSPRAEGMCEPFREATAGLCPASGASAWNGMLLARAADDNPARLREWLVRAVQSLHAHPLPRVWQC